MMVYIKLMMVKCTSMMVKWVYHKLISPSLSSISPSLTSVLPSLTWSKPSFAHLTIIDKLHRLYKWLCLPVCLSVCLPPLLYPRKLEHFPLSFLFSYKHTSNFILFFPLLIVMVFELFLAYYTTKPFSKAYRNRWSCRIERSHCRDQLFRYAF